MKPLDQTASFQTPTFHLRSGPQSETEKALPQGEQPNEAFVPSDGILQDGKCGLGCQINKGVLEPIKGGIKKGAIKAAKLGKIVKSATVTALQVAPTLGTLVAASALSRVEGLLPGKEKLSAVEWLQLRSPKLFNKTLETAANLVGSKPIDATGLSVGELVEIEEHIFKSLAPSRDANGVKQPARFISQLASAPFRHPDAPQAAFVYLGEGREEDSEKVMSLWNSPEPPKENPFDEASDLNWVWEVLEGKAAKKKLPVFIDLDGDARTFTSAEYVSKEIMDSMVTRHNDFGNGFHDSGLYYTWLNTRQESLYSTLSPWMEQRDPKLGQTIEQIKTDLTPPWLGGREGLGPWPSLRQSNRAFKSLDRLAEDSSKGAKGLGDFADTLISLDRDVLTATMTHWMKVLKQSGGKKRNELLGPLAKSWVKLHTDSAMNPELAVPKGAPMLRALEGPPPVMTTRSYDRATGVGEVVNNTLTGLGILERKEFMDQLKTELRENLPFFQGQDDRFSKMLGDKYEGLDFGRLLTDRLGCDDADLERRLEQLRQATYRPEGLTEREQAELHRHYGIADWLVNSQKRYGDVQFGLIGHAPAFKKDPLAVSQFFDQMEPPKAVSMLGPGPTKVKELGDKSSPHELKISIFREGGGGKGMAYPVPSAALKGGLNSINYKFDDGGGSSAGVIPSLLEAAGYNDEEIAEISARLDFKEFNSDAIPLLGGTDPKIGGVNQTGMFSSQKMYKELYELLSEKLGIEGRPILFRDLPQRIAITATVMNTDLPPDDPLYQLIDGDRRFVMNPEDTPNFDVIGAVTASTAVPAYFNAPQMQVARTVEEDGELTTKLFRMQFVDGGLVDNFPVSAARREEEGKTALVVVPAYYEAIDPETGEKVSLSTLNFDDGDLEAVNQQNEAYYQNMMPKLDDFMQKVVQEGYSRVVFAMNLTDLEEQTEPLIQGKSAEDTERLLALAGESGLQTMTAPDGREFMKKTVNGPSLVKTAAGGVFNLFIDGQSGENNEYRWGLRESRAIPGVSEEENVLQLIRGVGASALATSKEQKRARLFEQLS